jgi:NAD(P)-dependent dehydrogenase (short-subunit alcohol dehydrogenase family)
VSATETRRVALVTGGARGIGREIARQLLDAGLHVVIGARDEKRAQAACAELGGPASPVRLDVTDPDGITRAVEHVIGRLGRIDVLVNNAGIAIDGDQEALTADFDVIAETIETNLLGAWRMCAAVAPHMVAAGYGRIVNLTSDLGSLTLMERGSEPAYRVSKTALNALTRILAADLAGTGVLANAASPGWCRTAMGGPAAPRSAAEGARTPVWLATLPEDATTTGAVYSDGQPLPW